jgi:glycosyltransferase involved in cell wall biosynthesis
MHVLLIGLHRFTQPHGPCRYTANLFSSLKREKDLQVTLVLGAWQRDYYQRALGLNVNDTDIVWVDLERPAVSRYGWYLRDAPKLARELNADLVHAVNPMPLIKKRFSCPIVATMHDLYAYDSPQVIGFPNVWLNRLVLRQIIRASDAIISISQSTKDSLRKRFPSLEGRIPLPVVYQDVLPKVLKSEELEAPSIVPEHKYFLTVANHGRNKNLDLIVEAYYLGREAGVIPTNTRLIIVGSEGIATQYLRSMMEGKPGVHLLSAISDEQLIDLYKSCEALICASSIEGFCLPVAEALSFRRRVVCSDIPILREVGGEQATYFPLEPRSPAALVRAIEESLKSTRHRTVPIRGVQKNSGAEVARVYRDVLNLSSFEPRHSEDMLSRSKSFGD